MVVLNIVYANEVPANLIGTESYNEETDLTLTLTAEESSIPDIIEPIIDIINPKTGDVRVTIVFYVLMIGLITFLIVRKKKAISMVVIGMLLIIP